MSAYDDEEQVRQSMRHIAEQAATCAVRDTFAMIGIDVTDPIKAQEHFAFLRQMSNPRTVENLQFLDRWHSAADRVADTGWRTLTRVMVTAALGLVAVVTRDYWITHLWK